jgi:hypothetical protein
MAKASLSALQLFLVFIVTLVLSFILMPGVVTSIPAGDVKARHKGYWFHTEHKHYANSMTHSVILAVIITLVVYGITVTMNSYESGYDRSHYGIGKYGKPEHPKLHDVKNGEWGTSHPHQVSDVHGLGFHPHQVSDVHGLGFHSHQVSDVHGLGFHPHQVSDVHGLGFHPHQVSVPSSHGVLPHPANHSGFNTNV